MVVINISYGGAGSYPGTVFSMSNPSNGESVTNANLPPYYALCYIIKHTATSGSGGSGGTTKVAILSDVKSSGTAGGNFASGSWIDRTLNTEVDPESFVTFSSSNNYFALESGTYKINWSAPAYNTGEHKTQLVHANNTSFTSPTNIQGTSEFDSSGIEPNTQTRSFGETVVTITETTYFKLQHRCVATQNSNGLGIESNFGVDEVYSQIVVQDLSSGGGSGGLSTFIDEEKLKFGTDPSTPGSKNHQLQIWSSVYSNGISGGTSHGANVISSASTDRALRVQTNGIFVVEGTDGQNLIRATNPEWNQNPVNQIPGGKGSVELYYLDTNYPTTGDSENLDGIRLYTTGYGVSITGDLHVSGNLSVAGSGGGAAGDKISEGNTEAEVVDTGSDGHFKVTTEGTERLRVTSNGSVGIGTINPEGGLNPNPLFGTKLDVFKSFVGGGDGSFVGRFYGLDTNVQETSVRFITKGTGGTAADLHNASDAYLMHGISNGDTKFVFGANGNVGIGTTNPNVAVDSTNTAKLAVGIVTCNELYVNGTQITGSGSGGGGEPVGTIVAWSGTVSNIPTGYQLCDGGAAQTSALQAITGANVPDLRSRFIVGANDVTGEGTWPSVGVGSTGGSADAVVVEHAHTIPLRASAGGGNSSVGPDYATDPTFGSSTTEDQGESGTNKNLPPYYALCYIIKHTATASSGSGGSGGTVSSGTFTATAGSPSTLESYTYDSAELVFEYTVFVKNGSDYQTQKLLVMRDGTTVDSTQFAVMYSNNLLVQLDATISGSNLLLRATPETGVNGSTTYRIKREVM